VANIYRARSTACASEEGKQSRDRQGAEVFYRSFTVAALTGSSPHQIASEDPSLTAPLDGVRVIDLSRILAGPFATLTLADLGAEVIKIEAPGKGDDTRSWGPPFKGGESTYFLSVNRSKLGVTLNFKKSRGKELLLRLLEDADVLVENFRTGALDKLGLGYESLASRYPRLIYCSISGYGHTGPRSMEPGYDVIIQGESGVMSVTGSPDGPPFKVGISIADITTGMYAVQGILAAFYQREKSGRGQKVDLALLDSMVSTLTYQAEIYLAAGETPQRLGNRHPSIVPYETFEASDGYFTLGVANNSLWHRFCETVGWQHMEQDPLFAHVADRNRNYGKLRELLDNLFRQHPVSHWIDLLRRAGLPCGEVRSIPKALEDPHLKERDMILPLEHPRAGAIRSTGCPIKLSSMAETKAFPAPTLGQHNRTVYREILGLAESEYKALEADGII
jgi:crotonobetainyl-CoA:carnitine CoA-transferase CaiB-like acyl-CoA transferase